MAESNRGLGKGLDALFKASSTPFPAPDKGSDKSGQVNTLSLAKIKTNPKQPRKIFDPEALEELASSIKTQGILQPLMVRPLGDGSYELVVGERRFRAAGMAGLTEAPVIIRDLTDEQALFIALVENLQRENLNPIEEAEGYKFLRDQFSLSQEAIAERVGKNRATVTNTLRLLQLPAKMQAELQEGHITPGHARCLLAVGEGKVQEELNERIIRYQLSVRQAEQMVSYYRIHGMLPDEGLTRPVTTRRPRGQRLPLAEDILNIQKQLDSRYSGKSKISGTLQRGKIVLAYDSNEQLQELLDLLQQEA